MIETVKLHRWIDPQGDAGEWQVCRGNCAGEDWFQTDGRYKGAGYQHFNFTAKTWMPGEEHS